MIWLSLFTILTAALGWTYLSIGSRHPSIPASDRALVAIPAGLVLVNVVSFLGSWPFGIHFSRLTLVACAALLLAVLLLLVMRTRLPVAIWPVVRRLAPRDAAVAVVGSAVLVGFTIALSIVLLTRPIFGWDFYLYHWHYARVLFETGSLPTQVSPSFFEAEYAYPPLMMLAYGDIAHMLGHLSQLGPRLLPLLFAVGTAIVCGRIARVCLGLSVAASLAATGFALWSGYYVREILMENTDTINVFFTIAALYWLIRRDVPPLPRLLGGGLLLAGAYWTRYNGLLTLAVVPLVSLLTMAARGTAVDRRKQLGVAAGALGIALILASPHLVRNLQAPVHISPRTTRQATSRSTSGQLPMGLGKRLSDRTASGYKCQPRRHSLPGSALQLHLTKLPIKSCSSGGWQAPVAPLLLVRIPGSLMAVAEVSCRQS